MTGAGTPSDAAWPTDAPVCVEFELTPEDWVAVSLQHGERSPLFLKAKRRARQLLIALFLLLSLLSLLQDSPATAIAWLLGGGLVVALLDPLLRHSRRTQTRRYAETGIANGMFGSHRVELRPEGMVDVTAGYEWLTRWHAIDRVEEGEGAFLVYTGPNALLPIPHTAFRDGAALRRFSDTFFALRGGKERADLPAPGSADG